MEKTEKMGVHRGRIPEALPLFAAIWLIAALAFLAAGRPPPPPPETVEQAAVAQLQRKIVRQSLAVHYAAERFRRRSLVPVFE